MPYHITYTGVVKIMEALRNAAIAKPLITGNNSLDA
jgi:hypothetical protein